MPRYYFNVYNDDITLDDEGAELVDLEAARDYAITETRALAADSVVQGHLVRSHRVEITDSDHRVVGVVRFDEAVDIRD